MHDAYANLSARVLSHALKSREGGREAERFAAGFYVFETGDDTSRVLTSATRDGTTPATHSVTSNVGVSSGSSLLG